MIEVDIEAGMNYIRYVSGLRRVVDGAAATARAVAQPSMRPARNLTHLADT